MVGGDFLGLRLVGEADAMAHHIGGEFLDERGRQIIRTAKPGEGAGGLVKGEEARGEAPKVRYFLALPSRSARARVARTSERM